jgi:hypothetical protein
MKRSWLNFVAAAVTVIFGVSATAFADQSRGFSGSTRGGGQFRGGQASSLQRAAFNAPVGNRLSGVKVSKPVGGGLSPLKPPTPKFPTGPIVGPIKPPKGPIVGPMKPPIGPIGPIGPIKPPKGPIVGPVKPPIGPIGPIGPIKPPKGPIVGPIKPPIGPIGPIGPIKPPGGGGGGGGTGGGHGHGHGKHCWPSIVLGCLPCVGYGGYYSYYPPVYTQPVVVTTPVTVPVPVAVETPIATTATATEEAPAAPVEAPAASGDKLPQVPVGSTLTLQAKDLGEAGQVLLVMDNLTLGVQVNEWKDDYATATLPLLGITGLTKSEIVLVKADGRAASSVKVELVPNGQTGNEVAAANLTR